MATDLIAPGSNETGIISPLKNNEGKKMHCETTIEILSDLHTIPINIPMSVDKTIHKASLPTNANIDGGKTAPKKIGAVTTIIPDIIKQFIILLMHIAINT